MKIEERVKEYIDDEGKRHEYTEVVQINEDGAEIIRATVDRVLSEEPKPEPQPSQLDRIEESLRNSFAEAKQTAIDQYTTELLEGGIL